MLDAAKANLELYAPSDVASGAAVSETFAMPNFTEVYHHLLDFLPLHTEIFSKAYFARPMFPIRCLKEVGQLFGFSDIPAGFVIATEISEVEKTTGALWNTYGCAFL